MMTSFDDFIQKNTDKKVAKHTIATKFIVEGFSSALITFSDASTKEAAIVNKQEKDIAYVYTKLEEPLLEGTIFSFQSLYFLITEHIRIVETDVKFNKYVALICNVELNPWIWGYFKGPEESYINITTKEDKTELSQQKPILVAQTGLYQINDIIKIKDRPWQIIEIDNISDNAINYYSLKATTQTKTENISYTEPANPVGVTIVSPLETVSVVTTNGYLKSTVKLLNISTSASSASFTVPFGVQTFSVTTQVSGTLVTTNYKVE